MKRYFIKSALLAGTVLLILPGLTFAQKEKEKSKEDKKETQQIIITRTGDTDEKTVIEINGDKVKINGKDASEGRNENVTVQTNRWPNFDHNWSQGNQDFNFNLENDHNLSLFTEDSNRAMLGVETDEDEKGAKITAITKESGAEKAGLKVGDIITKVGDDNIDDADDVAKAVRQHKPGDKINVTVLRNGKEQKLTAQLGKWKGVRINNLNGVIAPVAPMPPLRSYSYSRSGTPKLGLSVQDTDDGKGVKVLQVAEESTAAKAGIKKDDIITQINDEEVNSTDDVVEAMRDARTEPSVKLHLLRAGKPQTIEVRIPRKLKTADM